MSDEEWRPVLGWESYEVSSIGRIRSITRRVRHSKGGYAIIPGRILAQRSNSHGYLRTSFRCGESQHPSFFVHRLVAIAFLPNPRSKPYVNHIDCNPSNNAVGNLEWCTQQENLAHSAALGRMPRDSRKGMRPQCAILSNDKVKALRSRREETGLSFEQLGREFGLSKRAAMRCAKRETYQDVL
jgi:hypothetical protein